MFIENRIKELSTRTDLILSKKGKRRDLNETKSGLSKRRVKETILPERKIKNNLVRDTQQFKAIIREQVYTKYIQKSSS